MIKIKNEELIKEISGCRWCKGKTEIILIKKGDKATIPHIEYCPICGMSDDMARDAKRKK